MMISPAAFAANELEGKTQEEIFAIIRKLQAEMKALKKSLEGDIYGMEDLTDPSKEVQIKVMRDYIAAAIAEYEKTGGVYEMTKEETAAVNFDKFIDRIVSIRLVEGAPFSLTEISTIDLNGDGFKVTKAYNDHRHKLLDERHPVCDSSDRAEFIDRLHDLHIGEWEQEYINRGIVDGTEWWLTFTYDDGNERKFSGRNLFPYNYEEMQELMRFDPEYGDHMYYIVRDDIISEVEVLHQTGRRYEIRFLDSNLTVKADVKQLFYSKEEAISFINKTRSFFF